MGKENIIFTNTEQQAFLLSLKINAKEFVATCMGNSKFREIALNQVIKRNRTTLGGMGNTNLTWICIYSYEKKGHIFL